MWLTGLGLILLTQGCGSLLPTTRSVRESKWKDYQEVQSAFDKIVPGRTHAAELKELGFDPATSPNIRLLTYTDLIQRFMPNPGITKQDLHPAVLACINAREAGRAYEIELGVVTKKRHGNVFADVFGFKRQTHESGWEFKGLILITNDVVIYTLSSGEPAISRDEKKLKPLGPLQELDTALFRGFGVVK